MRSVIARALWTDSQLNALGIVRTSLFSGDVDTVAVRPYIVLRWGGTNPGMDVSRRRDLVVWVHDKPNDYTRVDAIIRRMRIILELMNSKQTDTGWITQVDWLLDSGDLFDDESKTIIRTSTYTVIGSGQ